jgi:malate dehydrogenase (oxaloacetate-decarboxylating)(NADP+)
MLCGVEGRFRSHLRHVRAIIGVAPGARDFSALTMLVTAKGHFFLADTHVTPDPNVEEIVEMAVLAAVHVRRFGIEPKIALLSHSNFGSHDTESARKMRCATQILNAQHPDLEVDGEMHGDTALSSVLRDRVLPHARLKGEANVLIMPNLDAANIAYQMIKILADGLPVGPILIGGARPAHVLSPTVTARGIVNMTAVAVAEAQAAAKR